jgi:hypothetical protein
MAVCLVGVVASGYAWIVSAPIGSSPDDDYHQASIWCPQPVEQHCPTETDDEGKVWLVLPKLVAQPICYATRTLESAVCVAEVGDQLVLTRKFNDGVYPGYYYAFMHLFVGPDIDRSVQTMRAVNLAIYTLLVGAIFVLAPPGGRRLVTYAWLGSAVPLIIYFSTTLNPTAWAILGVGCAFLALHLGLTAQSRRRQIPLLALAGLSGLLAAAARADAGAYLVIVVAMIALFHAPTLRRRLWAWAPLALIVAMGVAGYLAGSQGTAVTGGLDQPPADNPWRLLAHNVFALPRFLVRFWSESYGWLDTPLEPITTVLAASATILVCYHGLVGGGVRPRRILALAGVAVSIVGLPLMVLQTNSLYYPTMVQVRDTAPLVLTAVAGCLAYRGTGPAPLPRLARVIVYLFIVVANAYAFFTQVRRYAIGLIDNHTVDLATGVTWWRPGVPAPMITWVLGCVGFALLALIIFRADQDPDPNDQPNQAVAGLPSPAEPLPPVDHP